MDWTRYITTDKEVLLGKPVIKGTRVSVGHVIDLLAQGWSEQEILENYPRLTKESLQAIFAYLKDCMEDGLLYSDVKKSA